MVQQFCIIVTKRFLILPLSIYQSLCSNFIISCYSLLFPFFFVKINQIRDYNTRLAVKQTLLSSKSKQLWNINIRFQGPTIWNSIDEQARSNVLYCLHLERKLNKHLSKTTISPCIHRKLCRNTAVLQHNNLSDIM